MSFQAASATIKTRRRGSLAGADELGIRRMEAADLSGAAAVSAAAFGIDISEEAAADRWQQRVAHLLRTDPDGASVAERDGRVIGVAQALLRERLWCLSLLAVQPGVQSTGAGRALLARALSYGTGADTGLIVCSNDPRALRLYALAGFALHPTFQAEGPLDRRVLPPPDPGVRQGGHSELEALAAISREIRGAPHTVELELALRRGAELLLLGDRGFAIAQPGHGVWLLVARDESAATALLWSGLELAGDMDQPMVRWVTGEQDWAIRVIVKARLRITTYGAIAVRGRSPRLYPFIPSGPFA